eukprot:593357-Pleurochrysis_carterae.AAC.1
MSAVRSGVGVFVVDFDGAGTAELAAHPRAEFLAGEAGCLARCEAGLADAGRACCFDACPVMPN